MSSDLLILIAVIVLNTVLSVLVVSRNYKKPSNLAFGAFGLSIILWTGFNYAADHALTNNLLYTRLTLFFACSIGTSLIVLSRTFPRALHNKLAWKRIAAILFGLNTIFCFTGAYISNVSRGVDALTIVVGPLYSLFTAYIVGSVTISIYNFMHNLKRLSRVERNQVKLFATGVLVYTSFAIISNAILPILLDNWASSKYGPVFTVPFIALTAYAIVKHRMFDIRMAIVRLLGYALTVGVVATIYSCTLIFVSIRVAEIDSANYKPLITSLVITTFFVSLTFHKIHQFVTHLTTRVFYQYAYSLRAVLDTLSNILVKENKPEYLIKHSLITLSDAIRPHKAHFLLFDQDGAIQRQYSINDAHTDILPVIPEIFKEHVLIVDRDEHPNKPLAVAMEVIDMQLCLRLGNRYNPVGAILFGAKKTGGIYTPQDIQLLTIAARNLSIAIENAQKYEQISHFADTLQEEVKHATTRLRHANEKLKALDKMKDDFISMASHQFRTPAGAIRQALHMINNPALSAKEKKEILKLAEASSEQLVTIVGTMLNISRIEAGKFVIDRTLADMAKLAEKILLTTSVLAEQKHTKLVFDKPEAPVMLSVDVAKVNEAMANYIENAIKYSPTNSTITIHLFADDTKVTFEVEDQGMGVPQEERPHLFAKFYRAQNARREQPDGNGIGLYVVRQIIRGHGGDTYYEPIEGGSRFGFWLPLK